MSAACTSPGEGAEAAKRTGDSAPGNPTARLALAILGCLADPRGMANVGSGLLDAERRDSSRDAALAQACCFFWNSGLLLRNLRIATTAPSFTSAVQHVRTQ